MGRTSLRGDRMVNNKENQVVLVSDDLRLHERLSDADAS
jgi:hypothetical protein